jgi:hypothetical protein
LKHTILFPLLFLALFSFVYAQEDSRPAEQAPVKLMALSDELKIKQFVSKLTAVLSTENREALSEFFLLGDRAYQYAAHVYQGTEIGQYEFQLKGVADFYNEQSLEALNFFSNFDTQISSMEVNDIKVREGATEHMQVYVVRLNVFKVEAAPFSFRVNMVETQDAWAILNLKN